MLTATIETGLYGPCIDLKRPIYCIAIFNTVSTLHRAGICSLTNHAIFNGLVSKNFLPTKITCFQVTKKLFRHD
jgi:hypothetical protein